MFVCHFIKRLKQLGYRVIVVTQYDSHENEIEEYVDQIQPLFISRKGVNPFVDIATLIDLAIIFLKMKPCCSFTVRRLEYVLEPKLIGNPPNK